MQNSWKIKIISSKNLFQNIIITGLLYLYIFQPPIISKYLFLFSEILIFFVFQSIHRWKPFTEFYRSFNVECNILIIIIAYSLFRDLIGGEMVYSDRMLYFTFQGFFFSSFIIGELKHKNIEKYLLFTGIFASFISITMMVSPNINSLISNYMAEELENYAHFKVRYRGYGFSENITFTYSYILGICAGICLLKTKYNIIYTVPFLTCLIGVAFNARIGFIPIILTICYSIFIRKEYKSYIKFIIGILIVGYCVYYIWEEQIEIYREASWMWISSFFYEISNQIFGTKFDTYGSTIDSLGDSFIIWPEGLFNWIFGSGKSLFRESHGKNSDIGYILQLNYGGVLFLSLIIFFMAYTIIRCWRRYKNTWFTIIYTISILALNYKGFFFAGTPGARFIYLLYIWGIMRTNINNHLIKNECLQR